MPKTATDFIRIALYVALVAILLAFFQAWDKDHPKQTNRDRTEQASSETLNDYVPPMSEAVKTVSPAVNNSAIAPIATSALIHVKTDTMSVTIDPAGGNIIEVKLLKYPETLHSQIPFTLLNDNPDTKYIAQSGIVSPIGPDTIKGQAIYSVPKTDYVLDKNETELTVPLVWQSKEGIRFTKIFHFKPNTYEIGLTYEIQNQTQKSWSGNLYLQLMRKNNVPHQQNGFINFATYFGAAISSPEKRFQKISFKEMNSNQLHETITGGWAAMIQHYFVSAWIPDSHLTANYFSRVTSDNLYTIGLIGAPLEVAPLTTTVTKAKLYAGPSIGENLEKAAPGLKLTIDYGWLWIVSSAIFWLMQLIYNFIGNWGWSIVIVTLIIKLLFYQLSAKSYRSMSVMKKLQPKIAALKERFGDDKQKFTQATLELYKKEKANPMSGCLPILVQIPVFIALYWVLIESVQLRHAPFIFWIHDLSTKDPYYILPVLMGLSMFLQQRLNPPAPDPMQAKLMMLMPIIFTGLFLNFPAGLMLYWFVNNSLSFLQQWYIMRTIEK